MRSKIGAGILAGLIAGVVFGLLMHVITVPAPMDGSMPMMTDGREPMMSMMARVVRSESLAAGWIYLLVNSVVMGGIFGLVLGERAARIVGGLLWGSLFGIVLWLLGALLLMPVLLGMEPFAPLTMESMRSGTLASLGAHIVCGVVLGGVFAFLYRGQSAERLEGRV